MWIWHQCRLNNVLSVSRESTAHYFPPVYYLCALGREGRGGEIGNEVEK